jgi:hypothetical protein
MKIDRVIVEVPELQRLEGQVIEKAAIVAEWRSTIAKIETELNVATLARDNATKGRETHALKAAMGETHAVSEIKHARAAQTAAEQTIADLAVALPAAGAELAVAEKAAESARHAMARFEAGCLARERVKAAARIDTLILEFTTALADFDKLGTQIGNMPGLMPTNPHMGGMPMSRIEEIRGDQRVRSALPKLWLRFFPGALHSERATSTLEASETLMWASLASLETTKAKAA